MACPNRTAPRWTSDRDDTRKCNIDSFGTRRRATSGWPGKAPASGRSSVARLEDLYEVAQHGAYITTAWRRTILECVLFSYCRREMRFALPEMDPMMPRNWPKAPQSHPLALRPSPESTTSGGLGRGSKSDAQQLVACIRLGQT
ncbi:uncharacterized protein FTOL_01860 [Fusarium torulosum]|uniref:Uncharacterized protein n=1 Tax=Fusarium torulosum TaxID=33205 RepID=A0AAE8M0U3_9HYPO|nr:uncharacterized protein FTOL_01860 [Fusarium torulosum]